MPLRRREGEQRQLASIWCSEFGQWPMALSIRAAIRQDDQLSAGVLPIHRHACHRTAYIQTARRGRAARFANASVAGRTRREG